MTQVKKHTVKVKKDDSVFDGEGGFYAKGEVVECPDEAAAKSLRDKGLAD